ncbi:RNA-dependent ATPase rok1 [Recurvomyces mirabilis]|uniref:RNA-dependent ATPase rok1 n=1 Tax=Recurvomyces mirabilis TaxID=574656 RepID=UPI002DE0B4BC|nr:RNA-dependent ATPase rok1 [Recurvomyces mirabilis]
MDPLKLLSRNTKGLSKRRQNTVVTPSTGQNAYPQLYNLDSGAFISSKKRKRVEYVAGPRQGHSDGTDFFGANTSSVPSGAAVVALSRSDDEENDLADHERDARPVVPSQPSMSEEEAKSLLKEHKIKVTHLNPRSTKKRMKATNSSKVSKASLYPRSLRSFGELRDQYGISKRLATNLDDQGYTTPTEVQLSALPVLLDGSVASMTSGDASMSESADHSVDMLTVAPTGSGKTLAFFIPILHRMQSRRKLDENTERRPSAVILAPTKELVGQIVNEGRKLAKGTGLRVTQIRKGDGLVREDGDDETAGEKLAEQPAVKADVLVSTPGLLYSMLSTESEDVTAESGEVSKVKHVERNVAALSDVQALVLDEADVLLDPLFREQTLGVWNSLDHQDLRVSLWSATMGSNIEELTQSTIGSRRLRLDAQEAPLIRLVVGLKDSAIPNIEHRLVYAATEQGKLMGLRQLLHPAASSKDTGLPLLPPFLIFAQTIERAVALHSELLYDIPAEAGGSTRIAVLHADLSDTARDSIMTRFRKGEVWVLITTDLLARGVDFRGVNGVVNYDIPTSSAAYVHRVGRTGRAGREGGVAVTLYSKEDIPYLKHVANVVAMAPKHKGGPVSQGGLQQWLVDSLPKLGKNDKQKFKKRGVESRTTHAEELDPKSARRARISSKAGFLRQAENNRKGAVEGSQRRAKLESESVAAVQDASDTEFAGFD